VILTHLAVVADDGPFGVVKGTILRQLKAVFLLEIGGTVEAKSLLAPSDLPALLLLDEEFVNLAV
jgi:hypothetical protein